MIKYLVGMIADRLIEELKLKLVFVNPLLRNIAIGAMLILASFALWSVSLLLVFLTIFFYFAKLYEFIWPAVGTAIVGLLISGSVTAAGIYLIFKPIRTA